LDIDIFIRPTESNVLKVLLALRAFGYGMAGIDKEDLRKKKLLIRQYAVETDIHPFVKGISFEEVWKNKVRAKFGSTSVCFASLNNLIKMKRAAGRAKDLEDLKYLRKLKKL
jgi:hypothetical protein